MGAAEMSAFSRRSAGLTLLEMMLAMLALSLLLQVMLSAIGAGLRAEREAEWRGEAIRLASSELAQVQALPFEDLAERGKGWREVSGPGTLYRLERSWREDPDGGLSRVLVTWKAGRREHRYEVSLWRSRR